MNNKTVFLLFMVNIKKKTKEDLQKEYEIKKKSLNKDISYESFMKNLKTFNKDKFSISKELVGIFNDYTKAFESIVSNAGGVDDGGCYPFAYILEVPLNYVYSIYTNSEILAYFVYLEDKGTFISFDDVELLKTLSEELKEKMDFMKHYLSNM